MKDKALRNRLKCMRKAISTLNNELNDLYNDITTDDTTDDTIQQSICISCSTDEIYCPMTEYTDTNSMEVIVTKCYQNQTPKRPGKIIVACLHKDKHLTRYRDGGCFCNACNTTLS